MLDLHSKIHIHPRLGIRNTAHIKIYATSELVTYALLCSKLSKISKSVGETKLPRGVARRVRTLELVLS